jgi:hypothetical protein
MKKEFLTGLTAMVLAIGFVLVSCEGPTGADGAGGGTASAALVPSATATTARGAEAFFAEGHKIVYFAGDLALQASNGNDGKEASLTIPDGKTLILADVADLNGRAVSASGKGSITVKAGGSLNVGQSTGTDTKLVVPNGTKVTVEAGIIGSPGTVNLTGASTVIVGTPGVTPPANAADKATFAIKGGTVNADATTTLTFAKGSVLDIAAAASLAVDSATKFAFEDPATLEKALDATATAGVSTVAIGVAIDSTGKITDDGQSIDTNDDVVFVSNVTDLATELNGSKTLVIYTGEETTGITTAVTVKAGTTFTVSKNLTIGTSGSLTVTGTLILNGTLTAKSGATLTQTALTDKIFLSGTGKIVAETGATVKQTSTITAIGSDGVFNNTAGSVYFTRAASNTSGDLGGDIVITLGDGTTPTTVATAGAYTLKHNSVITVPANATLTVATGHALAVNGTVNVAQGGKLDISAQAAAIAIGENGIINVESGATLAGNALGITGDGTIVIKAGATAKTDTDFVVPATGKTNASRLVLSAGTLTLKAASYTLDGTASLHKEFGVSGGATLFVKNGATFTVDSGVKFIVYEGGTLDVAATGIVKIDGNLTLTGTITRATGSKFVYSSTANADTTDAYIGGTDATTPTWTVGAGALFTEIAGTSIRREWKHEISGGTVTLNKTLTYNKGETDASELTVKTGGTLVVGSGTSVTPLVELRIRGGNGSDSNNGKLTVETGATLTIKDHADLVLGDTGTVTVNGALTVGTASGKVRTWNGDTGAPVIFGLSGSCAASIFYPSSTTTAGAAVAGKTYKWAVAAGGESTPGWKATN